jgi:hypothetical protein
MKTFLRALLPSLQRIANAMEFANAGNFREFEELLHESERRELAARRVSPGFHGPAARRVASRRGSNRPLSPSMSRFVVPAIMPVPGTAQPR